jgi:hypothetical protein
MTNRVSEINGRHFESDTKPVMEDEDVKSRRPCEDLGKEMLPSEANISVTMFRQRMIPNIHAFSISEQMNVLLIAWANL